MAKQDRLWIAVDVDFWETDGADITAEAQSLWLKCLAFSKKHLTNGSLTRGQLEVLVSPLLLRSNGNDPSDELIAAGLLLDADGSYIEDRKAWRSTFSPCTLRGWFDWNDSAEIIAAKSARGREAAEVRWGKDAKGNAKPNARVQSTESREQKNLRTEKKLELKKISTDSIATPSAPRARGRDLIFDALAEIEGFAENGSTKPNKAEAAKIATAKKLILESDGAVAPAEIRRRAENYTKVMPPGTLVTAMALASNWVRCASRDRSRSQAVDNSEVDSSGKEPNWDEVRAAAAIDPPEEVW
jgi:hypothetical protein